MPQQVVFYEFGGANVNSPSWTDLPQPLQGIPKSQVSAVVAFLLLSLLPIYLFAETIHIVVKGDTLWHISGKYLGTPFRWKEIWNLNKETVRNPDLIFPEQKIVWSAAKIEKTESPSTQILKEENGTIETATAETAQAEEIPPPDEKPAPQEESYEESQEVPVLVSSPAFVVQPKSEQPTLLTNLKQKKMNEPENKNLGKILQHSDKILFEKGDEVLLYFYKAPTFFSPGEPLLVARWKESLITPDGETALPSDSKVLDFIGIVEITQNITPHKSMAKVIEISDFLTPGDLLQPFPQ